MIAHSAQYTYIQHVLMHSCVGKRITNGSDPNPHGSALILVGWMDPDPGGQK